MSKISILNNSSSWLYMKFEADVCRYYGIPPNDTSVYDKDSALKAFHESVPHIAQFPLAYLNFIDTIHPMEYSTLIQAAVILKDKKMIMPLLERDVNFRVKDAFFGGTAVKSYFDLMSCGLEILSEKDPQIKKAYTLALDRERHAALAQMLESFQRYANGNVLPKWSAGLFRRFRDYGFQYGKRYDDIVSDALRDLNASPNKKITSEQMTTFVGYLKYHARQKGVDLTKNSTGTVYLLLETLSKKFKIDYPSIAEMDPKSVGDCKM